MGDAHLPEDRPAGDLEALDIKAQQGVFGHLHGAAGIVFVLAQKDEILPELVLGERGRVALEVLGQLADVTYILLLSGLTIIFKLDELLEFDDRGIV